MRLPAIFGLVPCLACCGSETPDSSAEQDTGETGGLVAAEILDDFGMARTVAHDRALGSKLARPQACYHGDRRAPLRWTRRSKRFARR